MQDKIYREIWLFQRRRVPPIDIVEGSQLTISLELMDYTVPAGATAKAFARPWAAETTYEQTATVDGNTVTFTPPDGFFRPGGNSLQIEINGNKIPLSIDVNCGTRLSDGGDGATPEAVRPLVERAEEAAQKAEDALAAVPGAVQAAAQPLVSQAQSAAGAASASATAAAASAESVKASAEQITANKEAIETITPDDTVIDGKPWTSKKIVDVLCPPIEETGNPVQCYPVPGYPLGVTASWEPGQEGEGEPSPENIRPITGRNSVTVERCGENLLDISQLKPEGYNLAGSNTLKSNTTYTFKPVSCGGIYFDVFITDNIVPSQTTKQLNLTKTYIKEGDSATFTTPSDTDSYSVMWLAGNKPGIDRIYPNVQFMLVAGTTAPTAYTPYTGQTNTLTLPETVYGGEVDAVSGEGQETWKLLTLDGTENWKKYGNTSDESRASCFTCDIDDKDIGYGTSVCNKFVNVKNSDPFNSQQMKEFTYTDHPNIKNIYMNYGDNQTVPLDEWKAYLAAQYAAGTPVQVCYKLATPIPFTATGAQQLPALAGLNTVLTDADSVTVAGRADPIKRITDLEDAVASQT